jgi:hypothetical protein
MNPGRRTVIRCLISAVVPLVIGCGGGRDAGGAQPRPAAPPVASAAPRPGEPMKWTGHVAAGRSMEVRTIAGSIHVTAATGDVGEIEAKVHDGDPGSAPSVRFTEDERGVTARVETHEHGCRCDHGSDDAAVDFEVRVPAGVRLVARTVQGGIDVDGVGSPIEAHTVEGGITIKAATSARAHTVNGSIAASFKGADLDSDTEIETVNGPVTVSLPAGANAQLVASTLNGQVHVGFPIDGSTESRRVHGAIGHGGRQLVLRTVNGTIEVSRGS